MKTIFLGLNELNFKFIEDYTHEGVLPNFKKFFSENKIIETISEKKYEELEPWIQWVTISTGLTYDEHKVFRLGDIVERKDLKQLYEKIEDRGYSVAAISPFNAENRLQRSPFFVSDPWTRTKNTGSVLIKNLGEAVSQAVNDNAQGKLELKSIMALIAGLIYYPSFKHYSGYISKILNIKKKGSKAIILDKLLGDVFIKEWNSHKPDFAHLFLNTGAHIQHHYMFNSKAYKGALQNPDWYCPQDQDPLFETLKEYDQILGSLMKLPVRLVIATGLHQVPHQHVTFYWRLNQHVLFLKEAGVKNIKNVLPRMSRDFLVEFENEADAFEAQRILESYEASVDNEKIFAIDNRGKSLFVELTYSNDIKDDFVIKGYHAIKNFKSMVSFVAIKNGEHNTLGYFADTEDSSIDSRIPLKVVHEHLLNIYQ